MESKILPRDIEGIDAKYFDRFGKGITFSQEKEVKRNE